MQPLGTAGMGYLVDEGMCQLVFQNPRHFRIDRVHSADRNPQLAIVDGSRPRGSLGHVEKCLLRVKHDSDSFARRYAKLADQIVILALESHENLPAQLIRSLLAF